MTEKKGLILLVAGGTGGHVFPATALNTELKIRGWKTSFITDNRGVKFTNLDNSTEIYQLNSINPGRTILSKLKKILFLGITLVKAIIVIRRISPDLVIGFGGSMTIPSIFASKILGYPSIVHEQNAILGRANRVLVKYVDQIATAYPKVLGIPSRYHAKIVLTGNPVRSAITVVAQRKEINSNQILILGGSQGAQIFSKIIPEAVKLLPKKISEKLVIYQQCRGEDIEEVKSKYANTDVTPTLATFFSNIPELMATSCLIISRAGASTIAELNVIGRPAILVPYPAAMDDHQSANARNMSKSGAGWVIPQEDFTPIALAERLTVYLSSSALLKAASINSAKIGYPDATQKLATVIEKISASATRIKL
ncbi:MAG: undecaprenyldiphospho-muramoylpentapeptide beta-N-acetylglucosaminyltransferase [Pseudomonadota bacterium]|nr:undecaprenyldiphospho-muramoylpentapeptide beta-N-acetylglucosaminyltransferase [Pseudomonadota bacterium]